MPSLLHSQTHFSLLRGVSKPKEIVKRCADLGYEAVAMTDMGNIGCAVKFVSAFEKSGIKPILGTELFICEQLASVRTPDNHAYTNLIVQSKNYKGWQQLLKLTSFASNKDNRVMEVPRISLGELTGFADGNLVAISGYPGSQIANALFDDPAKAYAATSLAQVLACLDPNRVKRITELAEKHREIFGKDNFFLGIQWAGATGTPAYEVVAKNMRWLSKKLKIGRVATTNSHYPTPERQSDHRVLIATARKATLRVLDGNKNIYNPDEPLHHVMHKAFFRSAEFYIPEISELEQVYDEEEIANTTLISDMCESYDIRRPPILPQFPTPDDVNQDEYMSKLCRQAWRSKVYDRVEEAKWPEYVDRVRRELEVVKGAGLAGCFLIVADFNNWAERQGMIKGPGRGSAAGCLISYLLGITKIDPILYNLSFERFYNAGRNQPGKISLPDIDCDFPVRSREKVIAYIKDKYGHDKVAQIATFNSMQGRKAITDVLRAYAVDFDEVKRITKDIPKPERITEELQAMRDAGIEPSVLRYALESDADTFKEWCEFNSETGECSGTFGPYFAQAMRLEGTKTNISRHAAAVVLAATPLAEMCPLIYEDSIDGYLAAMEYPDLEAMGQFKLDVLGVAALDKCEGVRNLLRHGKVEV
jgi:DNA polymerase III subunit alpha